MTIIDEKQFSDINWIKENSFYALSEIADSFIDDEDFARNCLIRILEHRELLDEYDEIVFSLIQRSGLFPYLDMTNGNYSTSDALNVETHVPFGMDNIVLHRIQGKIYRALMDGANVILSAPTSFGKSLLIDAAIASRKYKEIVVVVPTIALIDETRRRLTKRFGDEFKIITHPTQSRTKKNIYVFTQERFIEFEGEISPQLFVVDEFYKLSPTRGDERTFTLNHAFYKLYKSGAQFFLIGPNVSNITVDKTQLSFRYFDTNFSTVVAEVRNIQTSDTQSEALAICSELDSPTLIFCKSANSAYKLGQFLMENGISKKNVETDRFSEWLDENYSPEWNFSELLENGIGVHHGSLPRSVGYHILRLFNDGAIPFLLCTSTIIEGVNTAAQNIIIYDNKIANQKPFDLFTFNNIKGRAGRMFQHFVGNVFVLNYELQRELPLVDIPVITQPNDSPESLLIQIEDRELSEHSARKLRYLHSQDYLPLEIIRRNSGISPEGQVNLAKELTLNTQRYYSNLSWNLSPTGAQRQIVCELIFKYLMDSNGHNGIFTARQMSFKIGNLSRLKDIKKLIEYEFDNNDRIETVTQAIENVFSFTRKWAEFHFPRYLFALDNIQTHVFSESGLTPGDYEKYATAIKRLFMPLSGTVLEEYGTPYQISLKLEAHVELGNSIDEILLSLLDLDPDELDLSEFEKALLFETIDNL